MSLKVYYLMKPGYLPADEDFICELSKQEFKLMNPAFRALKARIKIAITYQSETELNSSCVRALIEVIYDVQAHQKDTEIISAIDKLNGIAHDARDKNLGLAFYPIKTNV